MPGKATTPCLGNPFFHQFRQTGEDFVSEKHLVDVAHVKHVNDPTEVRFTLFPPGVVSIDYQVVLHIDVLMLSLFFQFHAVQQ